MNATETIDLESTLRLMVAYRALRVRSAGLEIELSPLAFSAPATATPLDAAAPSTRCACGHDLDAEHNDTGCLRGCPVQNCMGDK